MTKIFYPRPQRQPSPLAMLEPLFAAASLLLDRPWPPDPYLRQVARACFAAARADSLESQAFAKVAVARDLMREARELEALADDWRVIALELFRFAARLRGAE